MKANTTQIFNSVCSYYGIEKNNLIGNSRKTHLVRARQMYCFLSDSFTNETLERIGSLINRNHSTVLHSINAVKIEKEIYSHIKIEIDEITSIIFKTSLVIESVDLLQLTVNYTNSFL